MSTIVPFKRFSRHVLRRTSIVATCDVLVRDLIALSNVETYHVLHDPKEAIWNVGKKECGWRIEKGNLVRCSGRYDYEQYQWIQKRCSIMLRDVKQFSVEYKKVFSIKLSCDDFVYERVVAVRNKKV